MVGWGVRPIVSSRQRRAFVKGRRRQRAWYMVNSVEWLDYKVLEVGMGKLVEANR